MRMHSPFLAFNLHLTSVSTLLKTLQPFNRMNAWLIIICFSFQYISFIDTFVYKVRFTPSYSTTPGFSYYSLLRFGVGINTKRTMIELMMDLPIQRILKEKNITYLPPWSCYLILASSFALSPTYSIVYVMW